MWRCDVCGEEYEGEELLEAAVAMILTLDDGRYAYVCVPCMAKAVGVKRWRESAASEGREA